jgi:Helix-turn-helix domain
MSEEAPLTISVPAAGKKYFGLSRNGAYDAAARGDLPTIKIGRLLRVPVRALERMLDRASGGVPPTPHQPIEPEPGQK